MGQLDRARALLTRVETIVHECCGADSRRMEPALQERAWLAAATDGDAAGIPYLERLRDLRVAVYGDNSRQVEQITLDLAATHARVAGWPEAAKLYLKAVDISTPRTGAPGYEYVERLNSIAMEFLHHGDPEMALALNQRAIIHRQEIRSRP